MAGKNTTIRLRGCLEFIVGIILMVIVSGIIRGCMRSDRPNTSKSSSPQDNQALMAQVSSKINQGLPKMVDYATRLDSTSAGPGEQFFYNYTLVNISSRDADESSLYSFAKDLTQKVCASSDMDRILSRGVTAVYLYRGNDGQEIGRIPINSSNCSSHSPGQPILPNQVYVAPQRAPLQNVATTTPPKAPVNAKESNTSRQSRCQILRQKIIYSMPDDAPLGDLTVITEKADSAYEKCMRN